MRWNDPTRSVGEGQERDEVSHCFVIIQLVILRCDGLIIQGLNVWFLFLTEEVSFACTATL